MARQHEDQDWQLPEGGATVAETATVALLMDIRAALKALQSAERTDREDDNAAAIREMTKALLDIRKALAEQPAPAEAKVDVDVDLTEINEGLKAVAEGIAAVERQTAPVKQALARTFGTTEPPKREPVPKPSAKAAAKKGRKR